MIASIVCVDNNWGIGNKNNLLVHIPEDMKFFKRKTGGNIIVMGRKTYDSLPIKPLPNRYSIVITSQKENYINKDNVIYENMEDVKLYLSCLDEIKTIYNIDVQDKDVYVIGGGMVYKELLSVCDIAYVTKVLHSYENVDTYFPNIDKMPDWEMTYASEVKEHNGIQYQFCIYNKTKE